MTLPDLVYRRLLHARGTEKRFWKRVRKWLIRYGGNPSCVVEIHGRSLRLPLSHRLPINLSRFAYYDRLPGRIATFLRDVADFIVCIDVGANVGDSIAALHLGPEDRCLAIEPNPAFCRFLAENYGDLPGVEILQVLCAASTQDAQRYAIAEHDGTASLTTAPHGTRLQAYSLDDLLAARPELESVNLIKIDTDGHDFDVVRGAIRTLTRRQPTLLLECDRFENERYPEDCLDLLAQLRQAGYTVVLVYDNLGHLLGPYRLDEPDNFMKLIFSQLTGALHYFDLLAMREDRLRVFWEQETAFFAREAPDRSRGDAVRFAARALGWANHGGETPHA